MTLISFFQVIIKDMANKKYEQRIERFTEKMRDIKINDDIFLGNDLSFEQKFLNQVNENCDKEIKDCEVSFYLSKKSMSICCETLIRTETIANKLLDIVDLSIERHFFCTNGLRQLGWCARYMLDRRSLNYHNSRNFLQQTKLTEFYWFNNSPNRSFKQKTVSQGEICSFMHCRFFIRSENKK